MSVWPLLRGLMIRAAAFALTSEQGWAQPKEAALPTLTNILQVLQLPRSEAERGYPVQLQATVTYNDTAWSLLFLQDQTAGIYVHQLGGSAAAQVGDHFFVRAATGEGLFSPILQSARLELIAKGNRPVARAIGIAELNDGGADSQLVEVEGMVQEEEMAGNHPLPL